MAQREADLIIHFLKSLAPTTVCLNQQDCPLSKGKKASRSKNHVIMVNRYCFYQLAEARKGPQMLKSEAD